MKRWVLTVIACVIGATACTRGREPTDAQLTTLLRNDRAPVIASAEAPLDSNAIACLRGWSGDAELLKGLAIRFAGEDGKKACRGDLDSRLADPAHNPDKLAFADVTSPKAVRKAMALQAARTASALANPATHQIPAALTKPPASPPALRAPDPALDLGVPGSQLAEAETLCQQVQQAAAAPDANKNLKNYAAFCMRNLRQLRGSMEQAARNGQPTERLAAQATSAVNMANIARNLLAAPKQ